ncbi:unnamed protein product [Acanthoscelides obtectus]|uniref:Uncharacterized protein n=1 Tax=Acanthoscelides obtectus TaxID=200917 RepID=A0A9P0JQB1_ACAOB|nr:unnamed protein product [Acanthoscelides obtectus]CAK1625906.1 hypothetical protein AOBTE_LOCUS3462 [Acanthoscelides obtectus]
MSASTTASMFSKQQLKRKETFAGRIRTRISSFPSSRPNQQHQLPTNFQDRSLERWRQRNLDQLAYF